MEKMLVFQEELSKYSDRRYAENRIKREVDPYLSAGWTVKDVNMQTGRSDDEAVVLVIIVLQKP